ncbi:MAG: hypothetical protein A3F80_08840 [Candidatus Melainabacteria bacterium RIFCSPLOWO2_12_FULL_35_11]|nr:MAG: hypothetical protein A3F80_08840 [Candidatus Melainabacteria bacterium RIFCSPLOWO2_12_FULL_35_11]
MPIKNNMPEGISPLSGRVEARFDRVLENRARDISSGRRFTPLGGNYYQTYEYDPDVNGQYLRRENGPYIYNTGTGRGNRYIPGHDINSDGTFTRTYLLPRSQAPAISYLSRQDAIRHLSLLENPDGTFRRHGFVGTYTTRNDGTVFYGGGYHPNNGRRVDLPPQTYINGRWYEGDIRPGSIPQPGVGEVQPRPGNQPRPGAGGVQPQPGVGGVQPRPGAGGVQPQLPRIEVPPITAGTNGRIALPPGVRLTRITAPGATAWTEPGSYEYQGGFKMNKNGSYTFAPGADPYRASGTYTLRTNDGREFQLQVNSPPPISQPLPVASPSRFDIHQDLRAYLRALAGDFGEEQGEIEFILSQLEQAATPGDNDLTELIRRRDPSLSQVVLNLEQLAGIHTRRGEADLADRAKQLAQLIRPYVPILPA